MWGGGGVCGKWDSSLLASIDLKQVVKNVCASSRYHEMDFFTFACNQKKTFGTSRVKNWVDSKVWNKLFPDYNPLSIIEQNEISEAVCQASGGFLPQNCR